MVRYFTWPTTDCETTRRDQSGASMCGVFIVVCVWDKSLASLTHSSYCHHLWITCSSCAHPLPACWLTLLPFVSSVFLSLTLTSGSGFYDKHTSAVLDPTPPRHCLCSLEASHTHTRQKKLHTAPNPTDFSLSHPNVSPFTVSFLKSGLFINCFFA